MMDWVLVAIGVVGFGVAGWLDLKTTEFPDWIPYVMIAAALAVRGFFAWTLADASIFINSVLVGLVFLGFGLLLYYIKQWGDGDAWLLGVMGFLFPEAPAAIAPVAQSVMGMFPLTVLFNFFALSFIYLVVYSIGLGLKNRKELSKFSREFSGEARTIGLMVLGFSVACFAIVLGMSWYIGAPLQAFSHLLLLPGLMLGILVFLKYGQFIERNLFRKQVPASKLKVGDVPAGDRFRVLDKKEIARLRKKGGKVWIKEGVRLVPVFVITLLVTVFYGSLLLV
jgi:Flp pilus assembly protein protease CpaA